MKDMRKVLDVFENYLAEDGSLELLWSKHGVTVGIWSEKLQEWEDFTTCTDAKALCEELCKQYSAYHTTRLAQKLGHKLSDAEMQLILEGCALACQECGYAPEEIGVHLEAKEENLIAHQITSVAELAKLNGQVYVHLLSEKAEQAFLAQAEVEGFSFGDGAKPTERYCESFMAVNHDKTINYVGANGRIAFQSIAETVGKEPLLRFTGEIDSDGQIAFQLL